MNEAGGLRQPGLNVECRDVVELITDYIEGLLDVNTAREIEAHLSLCDPCTTYVEQMRQTIQVLGHLPEESLPDEAKAQLVTAFRDFRAPGSPPPTP